MCFVIITQVFIVLSCYMVNVKAFIFCRIPCSPGGNRNKKKTPLFSLYESKVFYGVIPVIPGLHQEATISFKTREMFVYASHNACDYHTIVTELNVTLNIIILVHL